MIEPRAAASAVTFYPVTYTACSGQSIPCQNGGVCVPSGQYDYHCQCQPFFTGQNCE
ncbi:MAG: calcium-binding EGF-like domain-containing protein, partial [Gammaproteobacteria bacterium]|nr:calcium-binding EGF-like domain-containing protein [Gammaproteobacteria bacterium]